jgi:predicted MPP superfamily phosphohydrolase
MIPSLRTPVARGRILLILIAIFLPATLFVYCLAVEPYWIEVRHLHLENVGLTEVLRGKKAVHISDLHIRNIGRRERTLFAQIKKIDPDLIFLTGDYVKWKGSYEPALRFLSILKAKLGAWAVMGDYDYGNSRQSCLFCHEPGSGKPARRHNVRFLRNSVEKIDVENKVVRIGGVDHEFEKISFSDDEPFWGENTYPSIILAHDPLIFDTVTNDHDVLILAGDTHGGQIPLPAWVWKILGYEKNARYNHGFYQDGKKKMYVSRGIGTSHLPIRSLRRPELVVLHF